MLKNTDPLLSPDLLYILAAMGHGDEIAIVDANFPAKSMGERTVRLDGVNATGEVFLSHTRLDGRFALRLAVGHIRTTERHVARAWTLLGEQLATHLQA